MISSSVQRLTLCGLVPLAVLACARPTPPAPQPPTVVVAPVEVRDVPLEHDWIGELLGAADVVVRARVSATVVGIHFTEGRVVEKGALLFTLDPAEQQEKVAGAESNLAMARTQLAKAESDLARIRPLAEINAVSRLDLDGAVAARDAAADQVAGAEAQLNVAKIQLSYTRVTAPISGLAGIANVRVGDYVSPLAATANLVTISELEPIHVRFFISEAEYLDYSTRFGGPKGEDSQEPGRLQLLLTDGSVHPGRGRVIRVDRGVDPTTGALAVEAAFPNPGGRLRPGMFARVRADVGTVSGAVLVPQRAVQELQGRNHIFVLGADDTVTLRSIEVGPRVGELWLIQSGLAPGDRIVVEGVQKLRSGMKVTVTAPAGS